MLESIVGFLAKVAFWAFLVGIGCGIYLGIRYWPEQHAGGAESSCLTPAPNVPVGLGPLG
jgi:hypothetical protein